jgi:hypothetical protein
MKKAKTLHLNVGGIKYHGKLAHISMEYYNEHCVNCGSEFVHHLVDAIQFGMFADTVWSAFECLNCGHQFHFQYLAFARADEVYLFNEDERQAE